MQDHGTGGNAGEREASRREAEGLQAAIARVREMEALFDRLSAAAERSPETRTDSAGAGEAAEILAAYLDSGDWLRDYELDEAGLFPAGMKRGVLSQDGLYDLLARWREEEAGT